jgi:predicted nucleic acid-binding protein
LACAVIAFLDTRALIYYFEGAPGYRQVVVEALAAIRRRSPQAQVAVSRLGVMACRVKPLRDNNQALLATYDAFFAQTPVVELSAEIVTLATSIRATNGLKTPDALQAACALSLGATCTLITGDASFERVKGLMAVVLNLP